MTTSTRFQLCELALSLGLSEQQFFDKFDEFERAQILAVHRTRNDISTVMDKFPIPQRPKRSADRRRKGKR